MKQSDVFPDHRSGHPKELALLGVYGDWLAHADQILRLVPLREVELKDWPQPHVGHVNDYRYAPCNFPGREDHWLGPFAPSISLHYIGVMVGEALLKKYWPNVSFKLPSD